MPDTIQDLVTRLTENAEAVCRHYLSNGRRQGRYWTVGDVRNTPGRSLFVRLSGPQSGPGAAGHWTDAASAEHGDLLDVIRGSCGLVDFRDVAEEARRFAADISVGAFVNEQAGALHRLALRIRKQRITPDYAIS